MSAHNPPPRAAGKLDSQANEAAAHCLAFPTRPVTPEEVRRYRKSYFSEPGSRVAHPGLINDLKQIDPLRKFGVVTNGSQHVHDVLPNAPNSEYQRIALTKSEATYASQRREPLGKTYSRGYVLPAHMQKSEFAFGISGTFGESAKELLYPTKCLNTKQDEALYIRSHGSVGPGQQKSRDYQWENTKIDPTKHRFGNKTGGEPGLGASTCLNPEMDESIPYSTVSVQQVEDMRSTYDQLGKPRHLPASAVGTIPDDHIFGVPLKRDPDGAWDCIQGSYSLDEQQPDRDLGKPVNYGWKNTTPETRAFGVPTVRNDIAAPFKRSIADGQNYGDDSNCKELLYPEEYASGGIKDAEFVQPRDKKYLRDLFEKIGYSLRLEELDLIWTDATRCGRYTPPGYASIAEFRDALNAYLEADESGQTALNEWRARIQAL